MKFRPSDLKKHFTGRSARAGLLLCGAAVAATCFGLNPVDVAVTVASGISAAISHVPFMETGEAIKAFFEGVQTWTGGLGTAIHDWVTGAGGEVAQRVNSVVVEMRNHLGDKAEAAKAFFGNIISAGVEAGTAWFAAVRNTIAQNPMTVVEHAGKALITVAETWGVLKGLQEAYRWASSKFKSKAPDTTDPAAPISAPPQNITNIHLNIALSGAEDVGEAVQGLVQSINESGDPLTITRHLRERLGGPVVPLTADTPVMGSDVRRPDAANDNDFEAPDPFDARADVPEADVELLRGDDVIWASSTFNSFLRDGMSRSLSGVVRPEELKAINERLNAPDTALSQIDGGIILRMTPKGALTTGPAAGRTPDISSNNTPTIN